MLFDLVLFAAFGLLGLHLQRGARGDQLREQLWQLNYVVLIPIAAAFAFLSVDLDRQLLAVVACAVAAWWLTVLAAGAYATLVARSVPRRGALWLVGAFPNTGFIGFPLAHLAFGTDGLRLAVIYDQVSLVIPAIVVSTVIAQRHGAAGVATSATRDALRTVALSPPLWAVLSLLALRSTVVREPLELDLLGEVVGSVVGPVGFLLLGLSIPLHGFAHGRRDVAETVGAALIRIAAAPALVWLIALGAGIDVPDAIYLIAAMPTAFHALVIARLHGVDPAIVRLGVLVTSVVVVGTTAFLVALTG